MQGYFIKMTMIRAICLLLTAAFAVLMLNSCGMIQALDPEFKMPKIPLPSLRTVTRLIPGMPEKDQVNAEDPTVPFNSRGTLGYGHTVRVEVYEGARGSEQIHRDISMVDTQGLLPLGSVGTARVGGLTLPKAAEAIAAVFRVAGRNTRPITVHIISVENTPVVSINGDVREAEFIPVFEDMSVQQAVTVSGGRKPGSTARGVYIAREGQRRFFTSLEAASHDWEPQAGDIITLSPDI
jgi:protein involved in polysaccharide export with SLBB domain